MKRFLVVFGIAGIVLLSGCGNGLTSDFGKSGRYAFALIKSAEEHQTVLQVDVTKAFAQAEADAKSDADKKTFELLKYYLSAFQTNDETPAGQNYVKACHHALSQVFDENEDPEKATRGCTQALQVKVDEIMKQTDAEQKKSGSGATK